MKNLLKLILITLFLFSFSSAKEIYSGEEVISLSPKKSSKRVDLIVKTYSTHDENIIKKHSHKRRRKVRRPRQGR